MSDKTICHKCGKLTCWIKIDSVMVCAECACKDNQLLKAKVERLEKENKELKAVMIENSEQYAKDVNDEMLKLVEQQSTIDKLVSALEVIRDWKLPDTGMFWDEEKTRPITYEAAWGSKGAKNYMRAVADKALKLRDNNKKGQDDGK